MGLRRRWSWSWAMVCLAACELPWAPSPEGPSETGPAEPLEVHLALWCADDPCTTLQAAGIVDRGEVADWSWRWDGEVHRGESVQLPVIDGLARLDLEATSPDGTTASDAAIVSTDPVDVWVDGLEPPSDDVRIVFVPLGDCDDIPVVNIGGCLTASADPIGVQITAAAAHQVSFSPSAFLAGAPHYTSDQPSPWAVWRVGPDLAEGSAPGTTVSDYGWPHHPAPPAPAQHFTLYFDGVPGETAVLLVSHGEPDASVYSQHAVTIQCDAEGQVAEVGHVAVDRAALDHDGDGAPSAEDCDDTDPSRQERC